MFSSLITKKHLKLTTKVEDGQKSILTSFRVWAAPESRSKYTAAGFVKYEPLFQNLYEISVVQIWKQQIMNESAKFQQPFILRIFKSNISLKCVET